MPSLVPKETPGSLQGREHDARGLTLFFEQGCLRVSLLADNLARVRFAPGGQFSPRRSWDVAAPDNSFQPVPFDLSEEEGGFVLTTEALRITVSSRGELAFRDRGGETFAADVASVTWEEAELEQATLRRREGDTLPEGAARVELRLRKRAPEGEHYYGFGERTGLLDKRGRVMTNWTIDPEFGHGRSHDNLYQAHPFFMALRPGLAWGCFLHSTWYSQFDAGATKWEEVEFVTHGGELDYYIIYGPTPAGVVEGLTRLTGRPFLPPLWALGYHQSRWGYMNEEEMREMAREFRERDIPLDVLHFDIDYMRGYRDFTWHPERFPDPKGLLDDLREQEVRVVTIIDPGVKYDLSEEYGVARGGLMQDAFIYNADGTPYSGYCWPDAALFPDFAREETRQWWGEQHAGHIEAGVAGIWNDMNEPAIFDKPFSEGTSAQNPMPLVTPQGAGDEATTHAEVHNLYGLLMCRATYEGLRRLRPNERPWILTRSAYTGIQRYAACWMGDNNSWWEHLEMSMPQLANMGLSGVPYVGADIGGFFDNPSAELYARWIELGTFYPFMRTHTCSGTNRQEPWSFGPEVEAIARDAIRLRYRLLPYLYTLAHEAHRTGAPIFRPMLYEFPDDRATYHRHDQIMVGPHLLVAPIYHPGNEYRMVYLPAGTWYDFRSGKGVEGPAQLAVHAPLGRIPLFVRGGGVLPLGNVRRSTIEPLTELTLAIYPDGESSWSWIEDDGESMAYEQGQIAETRVRVTQEGERISIHVEARRGPFEPHPRTLAFQIQVPARPERVLVDGEAHEGWAWDEARGAVTLSWADDGQTHEIVLSSGGERG